MVENKQDFIVRAALGNMNSIQYENKDQLSQRLRGAISSLMKLNNSSMVISLLANFRSQLAVVNQEDFEFAVNFNRELIYGSLTLKS